MMRKQQGFTYLGLLLAVALMGLGLTAASEVWVTVAHRERIEQLEWIGGQYVQAIGSYYNASPSGVKRYPQGLGELLEDKRSTPARRHLRHVFRNPFDEQTGWTAVASVDSGVQGIAVSVPSFDRTTEQVRYFVFVPPK
jgi:type II secretory pathway pseudopilin PulG